MGTFINPRFCVEIEKEFGYVSLIVKTENVAQKVPLVYIVILNWNRKADILECINSLIQIDYPNFKIVVIDNGSTDGSVEALQLQYPTLELVVNEANLGVSAGRNVGIKYALSRKADYVAFLDNDTVVDQRFLSELVKVGEADSQAGILAPKIYNYWDTQKIASAGSKKCIFPPGHIKQIGMGKEDSAIYNRQKEVDYATGCTLLIKKKVFADVGLFDPVFIYGWDDYDFSERTQKGNYKIIYVPSAMLWHKVKSTKETQSVKWYRMGRANVYFFRKHVPLTYLALPIYGLWIVAREIIIGNGKAALPFLKGMWTELSKAS